MGSAINNGSGGAADLTAQIASTDASVKQVVHDRPFAGSDASAVHVLRTVETRNHQHLTELRELLRRSTECKPTIRSNVGVVSVGRSR
jgi:threonine dehydratase